MYSKKSIVITGGAGFIGSHIAKHFADKGHEVYVIDDLSSGDENYIKHPNIALIKEDISLLDYEAEEKIDFENVGLLIHCAAQTDVRKSMESPTWDAQVNVVGGLNVLDTVSAAATGKLQVIFLSSGGAVYDQEAKAPYVEESPVNPISAYGLSKLTFEKYLIMMAKEWDYTYTILRLANVCGPRNKKGVISIFENLMENNESIVVNGGDQTRDYVHVFDVVSAIDCVADNSSAVNEIFNVGTGVETSLNELVELLKLKYPDWRGSLMQGGYKAGEVMRSSVDAYKLRSLGWRPSFETARDIINFDLEKLKK